jgi:cell division protease FtsH
VAALLALNLWISSQALRPNAPVRIPYSPTFLTQVKDGNVKEISSTGDSIQGTFKNDVRYPSNDQSVKPTNSFATQVPSFANNAELSSLLQKEGVTIDAKAPSGGPSVVESLIFGFGPTLLLIALFVFIARRASGAGAGGLMSFGRSRAVR